MCTFLGELSSDYSPSFSTVSIFNSKYTINKIESAFNADGLRFQSPKQFGGFDRFFSSNGVLHTWWIVDIMKYVKISLFWYISYYLQPSSV